MTLFVFCFFFFKQKTAYEMRISDWSSDVCSSDLAGLAHLHRAIHAHRAAGHQRLAGAAAVAYPRKLEQLVEFDVIAVELEVDRLHADSLRMTDVELLHQAGKARLVAQRCEVGVVFYPGAVAPSQRDRALQQVERAPGFAQDGVGAG